LPRRLQDIDKEKNMNLGEFGMNVVENLIAAIPQLAVVGSTVVYSLRKIRDKTQEFPTILSQTKEKMDSSLKKVGSKIESNVNGSLVKMQEELNGYKQELQQTKEQQNMLVKENKLFIDVILEFIAKNPQMVKEGLSKIVSMKAKLTKQELEEYPQVLLADSLKLKEAISEAGSVMGQEELDKMLQGMGYERKE
jgi:hypothetical protein